MWQSLTRMFHEDSQAVFEEDRACSVQALFSFWPGRIASYIADVGPAYLPAEFQSLGV